MHIYVIRHAIAEDQSPDGTDFGRPLSEDGIRKFERAVKGLGRIEVSFDRILHSPLRRAVETAELLVPRLAEGGETAVCAELAEAPSKALLTRIVGESVALVGHEPWLAETVAWLLTGNREDAHHVPLKRGAVFWLEGEARPGGCTLVAALPPAVLRSL